MLIKVGMANKRRNKNYKAIIASLLGLGVAISGCAMGDMGGDDDGTGPSILALSGEQVRVGDSLEIFGGNFINADDGHTELRFKGTFTGKSGAAIQVDQRVRPHWVDGNRLVWSQMGPFSNPFSDGEQIGSFEGDVFAINVDADGRERTSAPYRARMDFGESIVIRVLRPLRASCSAPVKRLLGGFPYEIEVEAVGFSPVNFTYVVAGESRQDRPRDFRRPASGHVDTFGADGELVFEPVPDGYQFHLVSLTVSALGTDGQERSTSLVFAVHRPIEYMDSGKFKVAEILPAKPISGCMSGSITGRQVTLTETKSETRERSFGVEWNEEWSEGSAGTQSWSKAATTGINLTRNGSTTETSTIGWHHEFEKEVGGNASVGIQKVFEIGVRGDVSWTDGTSGSSGTAIMNGWAVGRDYSTTDTESWAFTKTRGYALSKGGSDFWTVSSTDSESLAFSGDVLPGMYGVIYRQAQRIALPGVLLAYDLCGNPHVIGRTHFIDYNWSIDLAVGHSCAPLPASDLPQPKCLITPCVGE